MRDLAQMHRHAPPVARLVRYTSLCLLQRPQPSTQAEGSEPVPEPVNTPALAGYWPDPYAAPHILPLDSSVGIRLRVIDLSTPTVVTCVVTASGVLPTSTTDIPQPVPGFLLTPTPLVTLAAYGLPGIQVLVVVGNGLQQEGAEYLLTLTFAVGGVSIGEVELSLPCFD